MIKVIKDRGVLMSRIGACDNVLKVRPPLPIDRTPADRRLATLDDVLATV